MFSLLAAAALASAGAAQAKPELERPTVFKVCRDYASPQALEKQMASGALVRMSEEAVEAVRRAYLQQAMADNGVALQHEQAVELMCGFYSDGVADSGEYVLARVRQAEARTK